jgi:hypothetical protein
MRSTTFMGVLGAWARDLQIITDSGQAITVSLNADDAHRITVADPTEVPVGGVRRSCGNGSTRRSPSSIG